MHDRRAPRSTPASAALTFVGRRLVLVLDVACGDVMGRRNPLIAMAIQASTAIESIISSGA
jgi:hypothetical protein